MSAVKTIQIVDDNEAVRTLLGDFLAAKGYQILKSQDGEEALLTLETEKPDLILLDVMLPRVSGYQVLEKVRSFLSVPIVMITSKGMDDDFQRAMALGADAYLIKPFSLFELLSCIQTMLN